MPQLKNKNGIALQQMSAFLFLLLLCCNQVFQFSHLHHFHEDDTVVIEVSYHPAYLVVKHSSAHQHGEEGSSHPNDTQHNYENQVDCNITRSQSAHTVICNEPGLFFSIAYPSPEGFEEIIPFHQKPPPTREEYSSWSIIRGPPLFG